VEERERERESEESSVIEEYGNIIVIIVE